MTEVPFPISSNPGQRPQEGTGRLINVFAEPRGDQTPVWRRAPGTRVFAREPSVGSATMVFDANARGATMLSTFFEFIGTSTANGEAGTTSYGITYPAGTESGDIVFLLSVSGQPTMPTTPTGFTELATSFAAAMGSIMWKASDGEESVTLTRGSTVASWATLAFTIRGAMTTAPICDTGVMTTGASGDPDPADITLTTANGLAVAVGWLDDDAIASCTAPTSFGNVKFHTSAGASAMVAFQPGPTTGTVAISSFDTSGTDEWGAYSFTMRHD